jgi:hypothetical protein
MLIQRAAPPSITAIFARLYRRHHGQGGGSGDGQDCERQSGDRQGEVVLEPKHVSFLKAIGGPQFLAAQFFTILATILGVYLAGYVGFQRTLEYDRFVKAQQRSDLLLAMHEELKQNVARLRKFNERLPADVGNGVHDADWPHLRLFVWQAAGRSVSALDIPPADNARRAIAL